MTRTPAAARWERQVRARLDETKVLRKAAGLPGDLWSRRAKRFAAAVGQADREEPVLARLLAEPARTYVDVGAGTGRYAIPLARAGRTVIAVEPSAPMRAELGTQPRLSVVAKPWPEATASGDVVFAAHVLFLVPRAVAFLAAMTRSARVAGVVVLAAVHSDGFYDPLWRHFHARPRARNPTFLDAVTLLRELGVHPTFEVVPGAGGARYRDVASALADLRENLCLARSADADRELRRVATGWLVRTADGLRIPGTPAPTAIIRWAPVTRASAR